MLPPSYLDAMPDAFVQLAQQVAALNNLLNAGARQTCGTWRNLTATTANTVSGAFERTLDVAWGKVATGAFDYKTAVKQAVDSLADEMPEITYPSGHTDSLEVNQTAGKLQEARMDEMNVEFVETSAHGGARPSHAEWQGRRFHRGGAVDYKGKHYPDFEAATGYGTGAGLCGWNCRHTFFAVFPELGDPPTWTEESLQELNARNIEYNGKLYTQYEVNQMQRARERNVRKWKKRYLAESAAGSDTTDSAMRLKAARQSLSEFAKATGGRVDSARVSVPKFGRSEASRANWAAKGYEKQQKDAIIIENLRTAAKLPKAAVIHLEPTKINVDALTFDDAHINAEREHRVSEEQAKQYIRNAKISVSVWNGQFERYYGTEGAAYVNTIKHEIRTAYSRAEFDENTTALIEEMKKNGILG